MAEPKDPAIKLFGKTIPFPETPLSPCPNTTSSSGLVDVDDENNNLEQDQDLSCSTNSCSGDNTKNPDGQEERENEKDKETEELADAKDEDGTRQVASEEPSKPDSNSEDTENPKTHSAEKESTESKSMRTEEQSNTTGASQGKMLKKPDKILPCPRCNSMDTKFCYYNNYNVNQPRHFCKNCQRYWTAGGTMRNVPVGAGRRKNKSSASHQYRHVTVPEALQGPRTELPNGVHHNNGTVLKFGSDAPLCESMASALNLADSTIQNCQRNGFVNPGELNIQTPHQLNESLDSKPDQNDEAGKGGPQAQNFSGFPPQVPCIPGTPWPFQWNSAQWPPPVPSPGFCPPGFPLPIYWSFPVPAGPWNFPWIPQPNSPTNAASSSGPNSPSLGKHSREESVAQTNNPNETVKEKSDGSQRSLWVPKTLRLDDPGEAAKSSIWETLGIKNEKLDSVSGGGLFKGFRQKGDERNSTSDTSSVLQANPAAFSRSINFHESS